MSLRRNCLCVAPILLAFVPASNGQRAASLQDSVTEKVTRQAQALTESLKTLDMVQFKIGKLVSNAKPQVKSKVDEIPIIPAPASAQPEVISAERKDFLLGKIKEFTGYAKTEESQFTFWAATCIIGAAMLALVGAILSFLRQHIVGGVAGLIVTAIIGFSNAYPLNALSNFYRGLDAQASALQVECELKQPFTVDSYNSAANQLKLLYLYESKRPGFASYNVPLQNLTTELQTVKTSSDTVEKTRALTN